MKRNLITRCMSFVLAMIFSMQVANGFDQGNNVGKKKNLRHRKTLEVRECFDSIEEATRDSNGAVTESSFLDFVRIVSDGAIDMDEFDTSIFALVHIYSVTLCTVNPTGCVGNREEITVDDIANYKYDDGTSALDHMCSRMGNYLAYELTPSPTVSPQPSKAPTLLPTRNPNMKPTKPPTDSPTSSPSRKPTITPTPKPTQGPTRSPSAKPTMSPTPKPTQGPTKSPSAKPTSSPTPSPTRNPTMKPTMKPTKAPTSSPSAEPTLSPTPKPTRGPTKSPSAKPTTSPTPSPTKNPTMKPTKAPTKAPTSSPSARPSRTHSPTLNPTDFPTSSPTFGEVIELTFSVEFNVDNVEELTQNWAMDLVKNVIEDIDSDCAVVSRQAQCPYDYEVSTNFFEVACFEEPIAEGTRCGLMGVVTRITSSNQALPDTIFSDILDAKRNQIDELESIIIQS